MHDGGKERERLFLRHLHRQQRGDEKTLALTVTNLRIVQRVGFANAVQRLLARLARLLEVLMRRKSATNVSLDRLVMW